MAAASRRNPAVNPVAVSWPGVKGTTMDIPGKVSLYCPLIDASGTVAKLIAISPHGYYHLEVSIKGRTHTMFVPIAHSALYFAVPEQAAESDDSFEIER